MGQGCTRLLWDEQRRPKVTVLCLCGCWQQLWGQCSCDPKPLTPFLLLLLTWGLLSSASWVISPLATGVVAEPGLLQGCFGVFENKTKPETWQNNPWLV